MQPGQSVGIPRHYNPINKGGNKVPDGSPGSITGNTGSNVDLSYMRVQLEKAKAAENRANQAYKALKVEHNDALNQLKDVDKRINTAVAAQNKLDVSPLQAYSSLQRKTVRKMGLGNISNRQSFGLAAITILLGITAIIGRVD
jgi:ferric-dicitrate binding protein FerR (iron transport regulator)